MSGLRAIPRKVLSKLEQITTPAVIVGHGCAITLAELSSGRLRHLGVSYSGNQVHVPSIPIVPSNIGSFSDLNLNGREVKQKDQPKVSKQIYLGDRPNYGDWSRGSFPLWATRMVYPVTFVPPRMVGVSIIDRGGLQPAASWQFVFKLQPPLVRSEPTFNEDLLFYLNLCKETVGGCDVFKSDISPQEIINARRLQWEIFPPGERTFVTELERRMARASVTIRQQLLSRARVIASLSPVNYALGTGFNSNYYGAILADNLVVFENLDYGNATYILRENWERLSQLSRTDLLASDAEVDRLVHDSSWERRLRHIIAASRRGRR